MRKLIRKLSDNLGLNLGDKNGTELRGFVPHPIIKVGGLDHEWDIGLPWYLKRIRGRTVLDCGFISHRNFTLFLAKLGFRVYGVDIAYFTENVSALPNFLYYQNTAWDIGLRQGNVDTVIANSLLEHMGLKCYKQPDVSDAEARTMDEFYRLLKPDGTLLIQVPYAKETVVIRHRGQDFYRTYTRETLAKLLEKFAVVGMTFYAKTKGNWIEVSQSVADRIGQGGGFPVCLCYVEVRKESNED